MAELEIDEDKQEMKITCDCKAVHTIGGTAENPTLTTIPGVPPDGKKKEDHQSAPTPEPKPTPTPRKGFHEGFWKGGKA